MSKDDDLDVSARLQDGWQYRVKFEDGSVEHFRDRDNLASVRARVLAAKTAARSSTAPVTDKTAEAVHVDFSGARANEGDAEEEMIGPVRGKGFAEANKIVSIVYSDTDGSEIPGQAFEAAVALLDVQRAALANLQSQAIGQAAGQTEGGDSAEGMLG